MYEPLSTHVVRTGMGMNLGKLTFTPFISETIVEMVLEYAVRRSDVDS